MAGERARHIPGLTLVMIGVTIGDIGFFVLAWQCWVWFRDATWRPFSAADALSYVGYRFEPTAWLGWNQIVEWFLDLPGTLSLIIVGLVTMGIGALLKEI